MFDLNVLEQTFKLAGLHVICCVPIELFVDLLQCEVWVVVELLLAELHKLQVAWSKSFWINGCLPPSVYQGVEFFSENVVFIFFSPTTTHGFYVLNFTQKIRLYVLNFEQNIPF